MDTKIDSLDFELYKDSLKNSHLFSRIVKIKNYAFKVLSKKRYEHSFRVAITSFNMCKLYGVDCARGFLAGISHDICKELKDETMLFFAKKYYIPITTLEEKKPSLLHGKIAAEKLRNDFNITDKGVLSAVANHTFGKKNFGKLGKIVYVADKIEPGRPNITEEYLNYLFSMELDSLVKAVLEDSMSYVKRKGNIIAPETRDFLKYLKKEVKESEK